MDIPIEYRTFEQGEHTVIQHLIASMLNRLFIFKSPFREREKLISEVEAQDWKPAINPDSSRTNNEDKKNAGEINNQNFSYRDS